MSDVSYRIVVLKLLCRENYSEPCCISTLTSHPSQRQLQNFLLQLIDCIPQYSDCVFNTLLPPAASDCNLYWIQLGWSDQVLLFLRTTCSNCWSLYASESPRQPFIRDIRIRPLVLNVGPDGQVCIRDTMHRLGLSLNFPGQWLRFRQFCICRFRFKLG